MDIWTPEYGAYPVRLGENLHHIPARTPEQALTRANLARKYPETLEAWLLWRWLGRYDLTFLCTKILGYKDVTQRVHGRLMDNLQKFRPAADNIEYTAPSNLKPNQMAIPRPKELIRSYKPICNMYDLNGPRRYYNMIPRGHLKTSVITSGHSIQWIINYPNVRLLLSTHTDKLGLQLLSSIRERVFLRNEVFRFIYPEHVPWGKELNSFGNTEWMNSAARTDTVEKERTVQFLTLTAAMAGGHYDVLFHDDLVDFENIKTTDMIQTVKDRFNNMAPLVERKSDVATGGKTGWEYLTGTFYDFSDLNYSIYEEEKDKPEDKRSWSLNIQSAAPNWPEGPYLWPERFGYEVLKDIETSKGTAVLAAQYLMNPIPPGSGLIESDKELIWTPRKVMNELYARFSLYVAVDLAGMDNTSKNTDNDYTAITLGGFGTDGHLYVIECIHGRPKAQAVIELMFKLYERHPRITAFKVEKEAHARVLLPFLKAEMAKRQKWLPIMEIQRDNRTSKQQKIRGLQPWFKQGMIHFADDLPCKLHVINEVMRFPKYDHDDILDTICDLMASRSGGVTHEVMGTAREVEQGSGSVLDTDWITMLMGKDDESGVDPITGW